MGWGWVVWRGGDKLALGVITILYCWAAGRVIFEEEGDNSLMPSSTAAVGVCEQK